MRLAFGSRGSPCDAGERPSVAVAARRGRRKARGLLPAPDAALGLPGAFLGMPAFVSLPCRRRGPPRRALGHGDRSRGRRPSDELLAWFVLLARREQPPRPEERCVMPTAERTLNPVL